MPPSTPPEPVPRPTVLDGPEERLNVLHQLEDWLETPMLVLSFVWLVIVIVELVWGSSSLLETFGTVIWVVFIAEFGLRVGLAPDKGRFIRTNWLTVLALVAPAFRLLRALRFLRVARAARGLRLVRIVGTANRGMNALRMSLGRRGFAYVAGATLLVALLGAAGMLAFEPAREVDGGFQGYGHALWWTAMLLATMGSDYWPKDCGRAGALLPSRALRLCGLRLHHGELRLLLHRPGGARRPERRRGRGRPCGAPEGDRAAQSRSGQVRIALRAAAAWDNSPIYGQALSA